MEIAYHRYGLKLREGAGGNARSGRRVLEGFLIRMDGGYGCVHPWPELGDGTLDEQFRALKSGGRTRLLERALAGAAADAAARREGRSLFAGLAVPNSHATVAGRADFQALKAEGFTTVKLKAGPDWQEALGRIRQAVEAGMRVRVDFNGTLNVRSFADFTKVSEDVRGWMDFVEDPVPYQPEVWEALRHEAGWKLALDRAGEASEIAGGFDVRILKPAADRRGAWKDLRGDQEVVFTSYMDHPVGQAFAAWEAGGYGGAQGLAGLLTHRLFEPDAFSERLSGTGPEWRAPGGTGLGFDDLLENLPWVELRGKVGQGAGRLMRNPRDPLPDGGPVIADDQVGFFTSGSTGVPAVVVHTAESLAASAEAVNTWLEARAEDVWLRVLPDFHVGGYQIGTRAGRAGSRLVAGEGKWDPARFSETCRTEGVTLCSLVPAQVIDLVRIGGRAPAGLRAVVVGGGALSSEMLRAAWQLGWPLLPSYGATEAGSSVATGRLSWLDRVLADPVGFCEEESPLDPELLPGWEARVPDPAADGAGLLWLRGAALAAGRFVRESGFWQWHSLTDAEGWWRTPDRVFLSGNRLRFAGRADRAVKVLGELVNLDTVERALEQAGLEPGRFAVLPVPEERRGVELVLMLETGTAPDPRGDREGDEAGHSGEWPWGVVREGPFAEGIELALGAYAATVAPFAALGRRFGISRLPRSPLGKIRYGAVAELIPPRGVPG